MITPGLLRIDPADNVLIATRTLVAGESIGAGDGPLVVAAGVGIGHKIAARAIAAGERIIKHRAPIGSATRDISAGEHVHLHNMKSDYLPTYTLDEGNTFCAGHDRH
jgi:altronate dehydratase small subunit